MHGSLNGGGEKVKNYISPKVDQFKENAVPQKKIFLLQSVGNFWLVGDFEEV